MTAEDVAEVLVVPRAAFDDVYERSADVREHVATLERVYELPRRGVVTQHAGTFAGQDCITTLFHLDDGGVLAAYRVVGQDLYALARLGAATAGTLEWHDTDGRSRALHLDTEGTVIGLTARGVFADAHALHLFVLDGGRLEGGQRARFVATGRLDFEHAHRGRLRRGARRGSAVRVHGSMFRQVKPREVGRRGGSRRPARRRSAASRR